MQLTIPRLEFLKAQGLRKSVLAKGSQVEAHFSRNMPLDPLIAYFRVLQELAFLVCVSQHRSSKSQNLW